MFYPDQPALRNAIFLHQKHAVAISSPTRSARAHTDLDPEILVHHGLGDFRLALEAAARRAVRLSRLDRCRRTGPCGERLKQAERSCVR